jgi:glycosyltransferase involved in cell wall biosynthesis
VPVVHTLHLPPLDPGIVRAAAEVDDALMVTVSETNARAWRAAGVRVYAVVPNGIALEQIPVGDGGGRLLYAGRISPEKGADVAIRAARAAGRSLILVGGVYDAEFFERAVQPFLGADARHLGRRPRPEVYRLMGESAALVMPIRWDEPFGLVAAEAQAAGTPVVGYARGALPEVVVDGRTGYLVSPEDEGALVDAIHRVEAIERAECRRNAERFSGVAMVRAYEELYVSRVRR